MRADIVRGCLLASGFMLLGSALAVRAEETSFGVRAPHLQDLPGVCTHSRCLSQTRSVPVAQADPAELVSGDEELPDVTVTANRRPQSRKQAAQSITVVDRKDIEALTPLAQNLSGLLFAVPGVQAGAGTSPFEPAFSIRGLGDGRSAVFVDGERQNINQGDARVDLSSVDPQDIERVEVLRGPASGSFGNDAVGGLINVITREPRPGEPVRVGLQTVFGGYSTQKQSLRLGGSGKSPDGTRVAYNLSTTFRSAGDYRDAAGGFVPNQQDSETYAGRVVLVPNIDNRISFKFGAFRLHTNLLAISKTETEIEDGELIQENEAFSAPLVAKDRFGVDWTSRKLFGSSTDLHFGVFYNSLFQYYRQLVRESSDGESKTELDSTVTSRVRTLGTNLQFNTPVGAGVLTWGTDFFSEWGSNTSLTTGVDFTTPDTVPGVPDGNQAGIAGYAFLDYPLTPQLRLSSGLRYDGITTEAYAGNGRNGSRLENSSLTPKAGLVWSLTPGLRLRVNYGEGFRVPSFRERFFSGPAGPLNADLDDAVIGTVFGTVGGSPFVFLQGNPGLNSLRSRSWEVGIGGDAGSSDWDLVYFNNSVAGLLNLAPTGEKFLGEFPVVSFSNIDARIQGVELQANVQFSPEWRLRGMYTWTDAIEASTGTSLASVIPSYGAVQLVYRSPGSWLALLQARAASVRPGSDSFAVLDINIAVPVIPGLSLTLTASNLTNSLYRESLVGFNAPGTQFLVGLRTGEF